MKQLKEKPKRKKKTSRRDVPNPESSAVAEEEDAASDPIVVEDSGVPIGDSFEAESWISPGASEDAEQEIEEVEGRYANKGIVPYSPLEAYLAEIRRIPHLTPEQEHHEAVSYYKNKDPQAAYKLVSSNLWLVVKISRDYERVARNLLDLVQEGNIGLMEAVKNFDPYRGVRFPSYAIWWIKAYIIRFIIANWRLVKIGTTQAQRKLFFNLKKESDRLEKEGITPSPKLLADRLQVKESEVVEMSQRLGANDLSIDAPLQDDSDASLLSVMPSGEQSAEDLVANRQMSELLHSGVEEFVSTLAEREKAVLKGRVLDEDKKTLQELSEELGISKERVRQLENKLKSKLRIYMMRKAGGELRDWIGNEEDIEQP